MEARLEGMRDEYARALHAESQSMAEQQRLQDKLNRVEIVSKRQENAANALKEDLSRGHALLEATKAEALEMKRRLILTESRLDEQNHAIHEAACLPAGGNTWGTTII